MHNLHRDFNQNN